MQQAVGRDREKKKSEHSKSVRVAPLPINQTSRRSVFSLTLLSLPFTWPRAHEALRDAQLPLSCTHIQFSFSASIFRFADGAHFESHGRADEDHSIQRRERERAFFSFFAKRISQHRRERETEKKHYEHWQPWRVSSNASFFIWTMDIYSSFFSSLLILCARILRYSRI